MLAAACALSSIACGRAVFDFPGDDTSLDSGVDAAPVAQGFLKRRRNEGDVERTA